MKYPSLPVMQCDDNCGECCGPALCTNEELDAIKSFCEKHGVTPKRQGVTCPMYQDGKCRVHPVRPFICRLFGHSETLTCSKGYNTNISPKLEGKLFKRYERKEKATRWVHELAGYSIEQVADLTKKSLL